MRPDLQALLEARRSLLDEARPDAVARQHKRGRMTVREVIAALADERQLRRVRRAGAAGRRGAWRGRPTGW